MKHRLSTRLGSLLMVLVMLISYIPVTTLAVESATDIKAIEKPTGIVIIEDYDDYVGEDWVAQLGLPQTVQITLSNGNTTGALVTWDTSVIDTRTPGYYSVPGEAMVPSGSTNGKNLKASITVQVHEYVNLIANGDFENGTVGWKGWTMSGVKDPLDASNNVLFAKKTAMVTSAGGNQALIMRDEAAVNALANAVAEYGAGQYYLGVDAMSAPYDGDSDAMTTLELWIHMLASSTGSSTGYVTGCRSDTKTLSTTEWSTVSKVFDMKSEWNWMRPDLKVKAATAESGAVYLDNFQLVPLKTTLKAEPAAIASVKTELLSRNVVLNYPDYVGKDWETALGLPKTVEVLTDNGDTVEVDVTWDYSKIDFTQYGKYTVEGTLDDSAFSNPKDLKAIQNIYVTKAKNLIANGDFEDGTIGWKGWTMSGVKDPLDASNNVLFAKRSAMVTSTGGNQALIMKDDATVKAFAAAVAEYGAGQYYIGVDAMSAPYDGDTAAMTTLQLWIHMLASSNGSSTGYVTGCLSSAAALSTTQWTTASTVFEMKEEWNWMRPDLKVKAATADPGAVYLDDFRLIPLNVTIPKGQEPADITEILTEIPVRAVIQDYDKYVGSNWQTALGLPESVEVMTSTGVKAKVGVTWNFETLNLSSVDKYTLVGTLDDSSYPNPQGLYVTQIIHIRDYKNMIPNASFENGLEGWNLRGLDPSPTVVESPVFHGGYAGKSGAMVSTRTSEAVAHTSKVADQVGANIALQGGGQYYYSGWMQSTAPKAIDGLTYRVALLYKTVDENGTLSSAITVRGNYVDVSTTEFVQSCGIIELPANTAWAYLSLNLNAKTPEDLCAYPVYVDHAEILPLNIVVEQYEGEMVQVETVIPDRQIIQNYPDYVGKGYTTADLMFPETVEVSTSAGEIITVGVRWHYELLDLTKTGTYTVVGSLEDMKIANTKGLTVDQKVKVVAYKNLLTNPSFEDYGDNWYVANVVTTEPGIMSPVKDGSLSLLMKVGRLDGGYSRTWIQAMSMEDANPMGLRITSNGGGRYYIGGSVHGTASSSDMQFHTRLWYRYYEHGDTSVSATAPTMQITDKGWVTSGSIVELPDDIYWSRMDLYVLGGIEAMKNSELYIDDMELVPLNVEIPKLTDIISCETVADVYVHAGDSIEEMQLPETLQIVIKNGQKFNIGVKWELSAYDPNKIGQQSLTGTLDIGTRFNNSRNFAATTTVTVRAKGEELRQTIYISTSGSEDNDGLSPENPKKEVTNMATYLAQGYNVKLKKGDIWYIPNGSLSFKNLYGTERAPLTVTSYGEGARPVIGFMMLLDETKWTLIDEKRNVWAADVTTFGMKNDESVHRCFVEDEAYFHLSRSNYVSLDEKEFCSYNNTIYIRMPVGESPKKVEVTPFGSGSTRMLIQYVSNLTFEDLHFKGASSIFPVIRLDAPTRNVKITKCDITHVWYYTILLEADDERVNYHPEFSYLYIDTYLSEKQGAQSGYYTQYWNPHGNEGITMRDGVDGAWIHHNHIRQVSHAFVAIESIDKAEEYKTTGVYNCIIEDNVMEGGNALYARPFNICGGRNLAGTQMCHNNIHRRNKAYDMTVSSHLYGENNLIYSNLFSYSHTTYNEDGTLFDGKGAQPWGFDTMPWSDHGSVGNMVINNTFYDVAGAVASWDQANTVYNNLYANNLMVNWKSDSRSSHAATGAFYDNTVGFNYYMNNALFDIEGDLDHFVVNDLMYSAHDVNNAISGYSGNLYGDPLFEDVDMTLLGKGVRQDFTLSGESPFRYAGMSINNPVYANFEMWEKLREDYTDINGVVYLAESPSIGAWSFSELITGDVVEVGELEDVLCRPGATIDQLQLPDSVPAVNDEGIDVILLITWNEAEFDGSKPGTVTLTGELRNGPHTDLNINGKVATVTINIKDKLEIMSVVTAVDTQAVLFGTSYEDALAKLPGTLHVVEESGFEEDLPVTWECPDYKSNVPGDYTFKCVWPADMVTNAREFPLNVTVRLMQELGRGIELLINPDFVDGSSASPWKLGWLSGNPGSLRVTEDPALLPEGEAGGAIVTVGRKYASVQQDVTGQVQLLGDGQYLFTVKMRAYDPAQPIDSSYACLQLLAPITVVNRTRPINNIGTEYVEFTKVMNLQDVLGAESITFHTSTGKSRDDAEDGPRSYIIAGCSFIYLGKTDAEVEATMDSIGLDWNAIRGDNGYDYKVTTNLNLPTTFGEGSTVQWSSSDESAITTDGIVRMDFMPKTVTLTATITYKGIETVKKYTVSVPRNPDLHTFSGSLTGDQSVSIGDEVKVIISAASDTAATFNAYRYTVSFNTSKLEYVGISDPTAKVELNGGQLIIYGIGADKPIADTVTVTFKALKSGLTEIKLTKVEMDSNPDATLEELPPMEVTPGANAALIDVLKATESTVGGADAPPADNSTIIWIAVCLTLAVMIAGGAAAYIVIRKEKQASAE